MDMFIVALGPWQRGGTTIAASEVLKETFHCIPMEGRTMRTKGGTKRRKLPILTPPAQRVETYDDGLAECTRRSVP